MGRWTTRTAEGIRNVHTRTTPGPRSRAAELLEAVAEPGNPLWPSDRWPSLNLDKGLAVTSRGGHGPIRYHVTRHVPGSTIVFTMDKGQSFTGWHSLSIEEGDEQRVEEGSDVGTVRWRHELVLNDISRLLGALIVPLHDQLLEDLLDAAVAELSGEPRVRRPLPGHIRARRALIGQLGRRRGSAPRRSTRTAADLASVTMLAIGALHAIWATGSPWPARTRDGLAATVLGAHTAVPGPAACLAVTGALTGAAALLQAHVRPTGLGRLLPFGLVDLGVRTAGGVLALRGAAGLIGSSVSGRSGQPYRRLDLLLYSPLCLALAWAHLAAAGRQNDDR